MNATHAGKGNCDLSIGGADATAAWVHLLAFCFTAYGMCAQDQSYVRKIFKIGAACEITVLSQSFSGPTRSRSLSLFLHRSQWAGIEVPARACPAFVGPSGLINIQGGQGCTWSPSGTSQSCLKRSTIRITLEQ